MAMPILEKSYEFNVNQLCGSTSSEELAYRSMFWAWKSALVGWATGAATVWGSSNITNWDNTGGDWWTSESAVATPIDNNGPGPWIVLNLFGGGQILMARQDRGSGAFGYDYDKGYVRYSPGSLFTGGGLRTLPTATDAVVWLNDSYCFGQPGTVFCRMHCIHSTDGSNEWLVLHANNNLECYFLLSRPENTPTGWAPAGQHVNLYYGIAANRMNFAYLGPESGVSYQRFRYNGVTYGCGFTSLFQKSACVPAQNAWVLDERTGKSMLTPISVASIETGGRGWLGRIPDLFWGHELYHDGDHWEEDPLTPTFEWMQMGDLVFPWDGTPLQTIG